MSSSELSNSSRQNLPDEVEMNLLRSDRPLLQTYAKAELESQESILSQFARIYKKNSDVLVRYPASFLYLECNLFVTVHEV